MTGAFDGKVAVVTGGAMGIGAAVAALLASRGAQVAILDRNAEAGATTAAAIGGAAFTADVSGSGEVRAAADQVLEQFGGVDVLVCSAGIQRYGDVVTTSEEVWDEVMAVNVKSMYLTAQAFLRSLIERRGAIVNVGSVQSLGALPGSAAYVASKHAVLGLTRAMAIDHAPHVRVNCVAPASVDTPMLRAAAGDVGLEVDEALVAWGKAHPLERVASADEVAEVVAFLAGPQSSFVTGSCWSVDGGMMARCT